MRFRDFEEHAREAYEEIPEAYLEGIDGLTVSRAAPEHPDFDGVFTLGECVTEEHLSDFGSSETTRSVIVLYWGSFRALARENPDFDWEHEVWETLTHELRHHLESLAGDDALEGVDYAADETFKRFDGRPFDPWYFQHGDRIAAGLYRVEKNWYLEQEWTEEEFADADSVRFRWKERDFVIRRPDQLGDVHFVLVSGVDTDADTLEIVLVRKRGWWSAVKRMVRSSAAVVLESEAEAEPAPVEG